MTPVLSQQTKAMKNRLLKKLVEPAAAKTPRPKATRMTPLSKKLEEEGEDDEQKAPESVKKNLRTNEALLYGLY